MTWRTDRPDNAISLGASQEEIDACGLLIEGAHITIKDTETWERFQTSNAGVAIVGCMIVSEVVKPLGPVTTIHGSGRL